MITIFRKIRQQLVSQNKFSRYLIYAIGEIILVVIGILIALKIDNWNERIQQDKEELKILKSLHKAITINIDEFHTTFDAQINRNGSLQQAIFTEISNLPLPHLDSLITTNVKNHTFDPSTGIYNAMINSGKIQLISNDSLKNKLSKLDDRVKDYQESEDEITAYTKAHLETYFIDHYTIDPEVLARLRARTEEEKKADSLAYIRVFNAQEVKNMYILLLNKMSEVITKGEDLEAEYTSLAQALKKEIALKD